MRRPLLTRTKYAVVCELTRTSPKFLGAQAIAAVANLNEPAVGHHFLGVFIGTASAPLLFTVYTRRKLVGSSD